MSVTQGTGMPSASFKFNSFEEIRSHSSVLYNERLAILFYLLDMKSINMNTTYDINMIKEVHAVVKQIYINTRMLIRYNPTCRATLNLDTKDNGIYTIDIAMSLIDSMLEYCDINGFTYKKTYIIVQEINKLQQLLRDILQYFHYFIRPDFRQKPDVEIATEQYKQISDSRTVEELRALVGRSTKLDFEGLGSSRIELQNNVDEEEKEFIEYNDDVDGEENTS